MWALAPWRQAALTQDQSSHGPEQTPPHQGDDHMEKNLAVVTFKLSFSTQPVCAWPPASHEGQCSGSQKPLSVIERSQLDFAG